MAFRRTESCWRLFLFFFAAVLSASIPSTLAQPGASGAAPAPESARPTFIEARLRFLGKELLPVTEAKRAAVVAGIAMVLGDEVPPADITATPSGTFTAALSPSLGRRMLQAGTIEGADFEVSIHTMSNRVDVQIAALSAASRHPYKLAKEISARGFPAEMVIFQAAVVSAGSSAKQPPVGQPSLNAPGSSKQVEAAAQVPAPSSAPRKFLSAPAPAPAPEHKEHKWYMQVADHGFWSLPFPLITVIIVGPLIAGCLGFLYFEYWRVKRNKRLARAEVRNYYYPTIDARTNWEPILKLRPLSPTQLGQLREYAAHRALERGPEGAENWVPPPWFR